MVNLFVKSRIVPEVENVAVGRIEIDGPRRAVSPDFSEALEIAVRTRGIGPKGDVELSTERGSDTPGKTSDVRLGWRQWREPIQAHRRSDCTTDGARTSMV